MALKVLRAGVLSTLQDLGRWGSQRIGVPVSGAMDRYSHRLANLLVGNDETEATVEMTLVGPGFTATREVLIAVCGAEFDARVNGQPFPKARPVLVRAGSTLDFGRCRRGCRAYLAVAGGFQVDPVLGSRSTFIRGGFGGWHGRALKRGDLLPVSEPDARLFPSLHRKLSNASVQLAYPSWAATESSEWFAPGPYRIRFMVGRHWEAFAEEARAAFIGNVYRVGTNSDRQGYRLKGPGLHPRDPVEVISAAVTFGTIQIPPDGEPIVLMANRQTTGGYPRLGEVVSADLSLLAQLPPGAEVRFQVVDLATAHAASMARERDFALMREALALRAHI
ncbi:MAG TPA: biotin-dependent carboxyltransferase family protein [Burkholderiales bacterium]|nr:biotin-dependent carboxyltransferase family protein [Burkholderiales bacterium]